VDGLTFGLMVRRDFVRPGAWRESGRGAVERCDRAGGGGSAIAEWGDICKSLRVISGGEP
jgi:hypothetical protein